MKVFIIIECYTDYKGSYATTFGVFKTKERAIANFPLAIAERCGYDSVEDLEAEYNININDYYSNEEKTCWCWDRVDSVIEFYIQSDVMED